MRSFLLTIALALLLYALYRENFISDVPKEILQSKNGSMIRDSSSISIDSQIGLDSVKAIIYDKIYVPKNGDQKEQYIFVYKNIQGAVWKIEDALMFWNAGAKGDSIMVYFFDNPKLETVKFYDVKPINQ